MTVTDEHVYDSKALLELVDDIIKSTDPVIEIDKNYSHLRRYYFEPLPMNVCSM